MEIVEFLNEFHISIGFGRFKDYQAQRVKCIVEVKEWTTSIFSGSYISKPVVIGNFLCDDFTKVNIPFEFSKDNEKVNWRKYESVAKWNHNKKVYIIPASFKEQVYAIGKMCRASHIQIMDNLPERVDSIAELPNLTTIIPLKKGEMRDYQQKGVARGLQLKRFINGDQPGLGKTLQSIATLIGGEINGDVTFPCLVICPASLKINWKREFEMWSDKKAMILTDETKTNWHRFIEMELADVIIVNYESLKKYFVTHMPAKKDLTHSSQIIMDERIKLFKSVIIDESHKLKNEKSVTAKICINITKQKQYIILLTGTPVVNKPIDLFSQLAVMFKLQHFGGANGFKTRYCEGGRGAANLKELNYLMNTSCYFMRKKEDVLKDLPSLVREIMVCTTTNMAEFNRVKNDFANFLKNSDLTDAEIKKKVGSEAIVKITMLLRLSAEGKIESAKEYIDEIIGSGQKLVIFIKHKVIVELLKKEYPKAVCVTGQENSNEKQTAVDSFQNNPNTQIIICNYKAAGVGLTLTAASELLMMELPWTQADCEQAEARCHRMGQPNSVRATYLLGENTLDQWMYDIIQEKKAIANAITGVEDDIPVNMINRVMDLFK